MTEKVETMFQSISFDFHSIENWKADFQRKVLV